MNINEIKQWLETELQSLDSRTEARMGINYGDETEKLHFLGGKMAAFEKVEPWLRYLIGEVERLSMTEARFNRIALELDHEIGQVEELQKALEWYADIDNWGSIEEQGLFINDGGERARTALQSIQGGETT